MKKLLFIPLLLIAAVFSGFKSGGGPVKYTSAEGHFTIDFPGAPEESSQDGQSENGTIYKTNIASYAVADNEVYITGWINMTSFYPKDQTVKQMLENCRDGAVGSMSGTNLVTLATELGPTPYIEFTFVTDQIISKQRIYLINKFQYSIITIFGLKTGILPSADKFIASFKTT